MNNRQMDKYRSLMSSLGWLKDNATVLATLPRVPAHTAELQTTMDRLGSLMARVEQDSSGYAIDKAEKRERLTGRIVGISRYALAYYIIADNADMQKATNISTWKLRQMSGEKLYVFATKLYDALLPDAALMPPPVPTDIVVLAADIAAFYEVIHNPAKVRATRKDAVAETLVLFAKAEGLCQSIELFMRTLIGREDFIYDIWRASRNIDRTGRRGKNKKKD